MSAIIEAPPQTEGAISDSEPSLQRLSRSERREIAKKGAALTAAAWKDEPDDLVADVIDDFESSDAADA